MTRRTDKVAALMQRYVAEFLLRQELPSLTTISKVEVSPDLKWGKVWITVMGSTETQEQTLEALDEYIRELQREVNKKFTMKFVPKISFVIDHGQEYASHINELLRKANDEQ